MGENIRLFLLQGTRVCVLDEQDSIGFGPYAEVSLPANSLVLIEQVGVQPASPELRKLQKAHAELAAVAQQITEQRNRLRRDFEDLAAELRKKSALLSRAEEEKKRIREAADDTERSLNDRVTKLKEQRADLMAQVTELEAALDAAKGVTTRATELAEALGSAADEVAQAPKVPDKDADEYMEMLMSSPDKEEEKETETQYEEVILEPLSDLSENAQLLWKALCSLGDEMDGTETEDGTMQTKTRFTSSNRSLHPLMKGVHHSAIRRARDELVSANYVVVRDQRAVWSTVNGKTRKDIFVDYTLTEIVDEDDDPDPEPEQTPKDVLPRRSLDELTSTQQNTLRILRKRRTRGRKAGWVLAQSFSDHNTVDIRADIYLLSSVLECRTNTVLRRLQSLQESGALTYEVVNDKEVNICSIPLESQDRAQDVDDDQVLSDWKLVQETGERLYQLIMSWGGRAEESWAGLAKALGVNGNRRVYVPDQASHGPGSGGVSQGSLKGGTLIRAAARYLQGEVLADVTSTGRDRTIISCFPRHDIDDSALEGQSVLFIGGQFGGTLSRKATHALRLKKCVVLPNNNRYFADNSMKKSISKSDVAILFTKYTPSENLRKRAKEYAAEAGVPLYEHPGSYSPESINATVLLEKERRNGANVLVRN